MKLIRKDGFHCARNDFDTNKDKTNKKIEKQVTKRNEKKQ